MLDQSLKPAKAPVAPSKLMSCETVAAEVPGFQSITAKGLLLSIRAIAGGAGLGNSAPLQNFLAAVTPGTPPRSSIGANHEVRYGVLIATLDNEVSVSGGITLDERPTFATPNTSTSPRNWNM